MGLSALLSVTSARLGGLTCPVSIAADVSVRAQKSDALNLPLAPPAS